MEQVPDTGFMYHRNKLLWGEKSQENLWTKHVMIFGLGGVGSFCVEALARAGTGTLSIIDFDTVTISNFNRQLLATTDNLNALKTDAMEKRIYSINPDIKVFKHSIYYEAKNNNELFNSNPDYVVDAIDSINSKLDLLEYCCKQKIKIISSMGAGNRLDPTQLFITDISKTKGLPCPFARKVRQNLEKRGIVKGLKVLTSNELPIKPDYNIKDHSEDIKPHSPGSSPFVPPAAGMALASYVIKDLL